MTGDLVDLAMRRRLVETGFENEIGDCIAYRSAVYEINYGDLIAECPLCGGAPSTHEDDPDEGSRPWRGGVA